MKSTYFGCGEVDHRGRLCSYPTVIHLIFYLRNPTSFVGMSLTTETVASQTGLPRITVPEVLRTQNSELNNETSSIGSGFRSTGSYSSLEIEDTVQDVIVLFIICIGILANGLALVVFQRKTMRNVPSVYFSSIAVADNLVLVDYAAITYLRFDQKGKITLCNTLKWLNDFSPTWSAWLVVAMTTERLVAISFPLKLRFTRQKAIATVFGITTLLVPLWVFFVIAQDLSTCGTDRIMGNYEEVGEHLYLALYTGIPSPLLLLLNSILLFQVAKARRARIQLTVAVNHSRLSRATISTIVVSVVYLILTAPSYVLGYYKMYILGSEIPSGMMIISSEVFRILHYLNHAINFFLYVASFSKFRSELFVICKTALPRTKCC